MYFIDNQYFGVLSAFQDLGLRCAGMKGEMTTNVEVIGIQIVGEEGVTVQKDNSGL